jgi:MFS family permease
MGTDGWGRLRTVNLFICISIACSLSVGWLTNAGWWIVMPVVLIYGFSVIADSPVYNTTITEITDPDVVGVALGVQSVLGFGITVVSPVVFGLPLDWYNWGVAFMAIGFGTIITPLCIMYLRRFALLEETKNSSFISRL